VIDYKSLQNEDDSSVCTEFARNILVSLSNCVTIYYFHCPDTALGTSESLFEHDSRDHRTHTEHNMQISADNFQCAEAPETIVQDILKDLKRSWEEMERVSIGTMPREYNAACSVASCQALAASNHSCF